MDMFPIMILSEFSAARSFLDEFSAAMPAARANAMERLSVQSREEKWSYEDFDCARQDLECDFDYNMPRVMNRSFVVYLHSVVEHSLARIARDVHKRRGISLKPKEVNGPPIERTSTYLAKVAGIRVNELEDWQFLRDVARVRDVIVHRGGEIGEDAAERNRLRELCTRYAGLIDVSRGGWNEASSEIEFDTPFCRAATDRCYSFFRELTSLTRADLKEFPGKSVPFLPET
jgi:hypothetical protein